MIELKERSKERYLMSRKRLTSWVELNGNVPYGSEIGKLQVEGFNLAAWLCEMGRGVLRGVYSDANQECLRIFAPRWIAVQ